MRFFKAIPLIFSATLMSGIVQANQLTILHINDHHSHLRADGRMSLNIGGDNTRVRSGGFPAIVSTFDKLSAGKNNVLNCMQVMLFQDPYFLLYLKAKLMPL